MENASKALLISGVVLLSIILITVAVTLINMFSNKTKEYNDTVALVELQKFNRNFEVYVGRENITAQEIVSIVSFAKENGNYVKIYLGSSTLEFSLSYTQEDFLKANNLNFFSCKTGLIYDNFGRVSSLKFTKN